MRSALDAAVVAARKAGVAYYADPANRASAERDFGGIAQGKCILHAEPANAEACQRFLSALAHGGLGCTLRGSGYSQSGQSIALDTVSLSTRRLDWIGEVDRSAQTITLGAGATLRRALVAMRESGLMPPVLPLNLDMTIGGLLSAGGVGSTSHRHGPVVANVLEVEVVTADGALRSCTKQQNSELYNAVLAGIGQCGLITQAKLRLDAVPRRMQVFSFIYDDITRWLEDEIAVSTAEMEVHVEGFCWAAAKGLRSTPTGPSPYTHWMYGLQLAADAEATGGTALTSLLSSLRPLRKLDEYQTDIESFSHRYEPRYSAMVQAGTWAEPHPWFEAFVPLDHSAEILRRVLELIPAEVGDGHRFMLLNTQQLPDNFICPPGRYAGTITVFPVGFARIALPKILATIDRLTSLIVDAYGRRYLSGWLGTDSPGYLRAHYGNRFDEWLARRQRYDPGCLFRSALSPDGHRG
jgi:cytokinin dehydrogenase